MTVAHENRPVRAMTLLRFGCLGVDFGRGSSVMERDFMSEPDIATATRRLETRRDPVDRQLDEPEEPIALRIVRRDRLPVRP